MTKIGGGGGGVGGGGVKRGSKDSRLTGHHNEAKGSGHRVAKNPLQDNNTEVTRFTLPPSLVGFSKS